MDFIYLNTNKFEIRLKKQELQNADTFTRFIKHIAISEKADCFYLIKVQFYNQAFHFIFTKIKEKTIKRSVKETGKKIYTLSFKDSENMLLAIHILNKTNLRFAKIYSFDNRYHIITSFENPVILNSIRDFCSNIGHCPLLASVIKEHGKLLFKDKDFSYIDGLFFKNSPL